MLQLITLSRKRIIMSEVIACLILLIQGPILFLYHQGHMY